MHILFKGKNTLTRRLCVVALRLRWGFDVIGFFLQYDHHHCPWSLRSDPNP